MEHDSLNWTQSMNKSALSVSAETFNQRRLPTVSNKNLQDGDYDHSNYNEIMLTPEKKKSKDGLDFESDMSDFGYEPTIKQHQFTAVPQPSQALAQNMDSITN